MKRTFALALATLFFSSLGFASSVFATVPPTLALAATGSGDNVQITITGDPDASVLLSYTEAGSGPQIVSLGTTDGNGNFSDTVSSATYGLISGTPVVAILDSTSGPKSPTADWPTVTSANSLSLSQNGIVVNAGSSATLTASNLGSGALYISNNSNPSVANVSVSGSQVSVSGNTAGSTNVTVCEVGNTATCPNIYVTVEQAGAGQLSLSETSASVVSGQDLPITISGGSGVYEVANNSNTGVIQASVNGSVLTLTTGSSSGSASVTVCSSDLSECAVVEATAGSASSAAVSFSNSAPIVSTDETTSVNIYGPSGAQFYVSSNSQPSVVQANLSGTTLTLTGIEQGSASIEVCASTGTCATLTATVEYAAGGGNIALSQTALPLVAGQSISVTISGGEQPYTVSGGTSSVAQETLDGNDLTVYGVATGTFQVDVCSAGGGCVPLNITVNGSSTTASTFSMSESDASLATGQSTDVTLYGNGSYSLSGNTSPNVATVSISGSEAVVSGLEDGSTNATICETSGSCATLYITVTAEPTAAVTTTTATPADTFTDYLAPGSENAQVTALQELLAAQGDFSATATGYYGDATEAAVVKFQNANNINPLGVVGPATRTVLNQLEGAGTASASVSSTAIGSMTLSQLQTEVESLETDLNQVLSRITQLTAQ